MLPILLLRACLGVYLPCEHTPLFNQVLSHVWFLPSVPTLPLSPVNHAYSAWGRLRIHAYIYLSDTAYAPFTIPLLPLLRIATLIPDLASMQIKSRSINRARLRSDSYTMVAQLIKQRRFLWQSVQQPRRPQIRLRLAQATSSGSSFASRTYGYFPLSSPSILSAFRSLGTHRS
jgi:hypothetical protein